MTIAIRPLVAPDRAAWLPLWQGYLAFYEASLPPEVTEATWDRLVAPGREPYGLGAFEPSGRLVGIVHYLFHASTWTVAPVCYLQDLYVDPQARGSGAGRALIEAVYRAADQAGAAQVYWLTQHFNARARALYDQVATLTPFVKYRR